MNTLEEFITNSLVVKVDSYADIILFMTHCKKIGLERIRDFYRVCKDDCSWMWHNIPFEELCIEYQIGKGFTISDKTGNLDYGNKIVTLNKFIEDTTIKTYFTKEHLPIFKEAYDLSDKINVALIKLENGERKNVTYFKDKNKLIATLDKLFDSGKLDYEVYKIEEL